MTTPSHPIHPVRSGGASRKAEMRIKCWEKVGNCNDPQVATEEKKKKMMINSRNRGDWIAFGIEEMVEEEKEEDNHGLVMLLLVGQPFALRNLIDNISGWWTV